MILTTKDLRYTYQNGETINFPDVALDVGKKVLIVGYSGSGKTTLLNLIAGALKVQQGEITLAEKNYSSLSSGQLDKIRADNIGYIFQTLNLIPFLSVMENIELGVRFSKNRRSNVSDLTQEIVRLLTSLGLGKKVLDTSVNRLSIGQQQRVAVARALLGQPALVLADEPTSALDKESAKNFLNELSTTFDTSKQALLMVSHDLSLAPYFDQVIDITNKNV
ncbi:MAG: ATP-binding cassette domain-containing protein [Candidatus Thioglobus sp.]|uniref:ABC transporter ATP-binding protein n=1 Tax=Candidatus Thioglobus sp. TaxID=2026721 RepID=UPI00262A2A03|nr:ATP-binding cassette domain-containing protein [Candidatus Thioglobus sp.]MDC9726528.1 ATP-binding cassette domain-containing protein [Candidatus Thioglobus sp.]